MADNLRITTPIPGGENVNRLSPSKPTERSVVNPALVPPANTDRQSGQQNNNLEFSFLLNRNSVFSKFVQQLGKTPDLSQSLGKLAFEIFNRAGQAEAGSSISEALKQLSQSLNMGREDIVRNLSFQGNHRTQFTGPLFQMLRQVSAQYPESGFDERVSQFLKAFNAYTGAESTTRAVIHQLEQLSNQIPNPHSAQLRQLTEELTTERPLDHLNQNLKVLKNKIIPFLSRYISVTNDFGRARNTITFLVHDLARLNISSREELAEKFTSLLDFCKYDLNFSPHKLNEMTSVFLEHMSQAETAPENKLFDSIIKLLTENGAGNSQRSQELYQNTVSSLLMDNSVYMPFHHLFLPLNFQGKFLFGEIWIEKEESKTSGDGRASDEKSRQIILTFDIKSKGYFEALLTLSGKKISVLLNCPAEFSGETKEISAAVADIFARNGLEPEKIELTTGDAPFATRIILNKVQERRRMIDVSV